MIEFSQIINSLLGGEQGLLTDQQIQALSFISDEDSNRWNLDALIESFYSDKTIFHLPVFDSERPICLTFLPVVTNAGDSSVHCVISNPSGFWPSVVSRDFSQSSSAPLIYQIDFPIVGIESGLLRELLTKNLDAICLVLMNPGLRNLSEPWCIPQVSATFKKDSLTSSALLLAMRLSTLEVNDDQYELLCHCFSPPPQLPSPVVDISPRLIRSVQDMCATGRCGLTPETVLIIENGVRPPIPDSLLIAFERSQWIHLVGRQGVSLSLFQYPDTHEVKFVIVDTQKEWPSILKTGGFFAPDQLDFDIFCFVVARRNISRDFLRMLSSLIAYLNQPQPGSRGVNIDFLCSLVTAREGTPYNPSQKEGVHHYYNRLSTNMPVLPYEGRDPAIKVLLLALVMTCRDAADSTALTQFVRDINAGLQVVEFPQPQPLNQSVPPQGEAIEALKQLKERFQYCRTGFLLSMEFVFDDQTSAQAFADLLKQSLGIGIITECGKDCYQTMDSNKRLLNLWSVCLNQNGLKAYISFFYPNLAPSITQKLSDNLTRLLDRNHVCSWLDHNPEKSQKVRRQLRELMFGEASDPMHALGEIVGACADVPAEKPWNDVKAFNLGNKACVERLLQDLGLPRRAPVSSSFGEYCMWRKKQEADKGAAAAAPANIYYR